ncbi:MAG: DUF6301 family protein [Dermatophilaceae bacterium]
MELIDVTWKAMAPEEVLRILTFWNDAAWPLSKDQVKERAVSGLGWTLNDEGLLDDTVTGLTPPDAMVSASRRSASRISFNLTDLERDRSETPQWLRWRNDRYTETVRILTEAWGRPTLIGGDYPKARWDLSTGARAHITKHDTWIDVTFITPQAAEVDRSLGY